MPLDILTANDRPGEYPASYYAETAAVRPPRETAHGELTADVCIVGGGYTGLSAALHLAEAGFDVILLEAHRVGWGASGRNGGQCASGQRREQDELEERYGHETARKLWEFGAEAKALVCALTEKHSIECEITPGVLHTFHRERFVAHGRAYVEKLAREYGYPHARFLDREEIRATVASPAYFGGVQDDGAFHLHPLKYALGLAAAAEAAGAKIFEGTRVTDMASGPRAVVRTQSAQVTCGHVLIACNGYLGGLAPQVAARVMPINNFIVATEPLGEAGAKALIANDAAVADSRNVINYFRLSRDHRLLFGGGESYGYRFPADIAATVRKPMLGVFPQLKDIGIDYAWGGTLAITMSRMPALQRLSDNVLSASGYSGHGVTIATLAGKICAEAIAGQAGRFDVFAGLPSRRFPGGVRLRWPLLVLAMTWFALLDRL
jgi:gamma-glutamylputrescine oxidase